MNYETESLTARIRSLITDKRMPWRVNTWLYRRRVNTMRKVCDTDVLATRPYLTGGEFPHFEVHLLLGHYHVGMCLWAVKSFLHYSGRRYSIFLHEDGTLTERDVDLLEEHLIGVNIVRKASADELVREKIGNLPNCFEYRFLSNQTADHRGRNYNMNIFALRLFDFNFVSQSTKNLVLDADVLFFKKPQEIMEWAEETADRNNLYSVEGHVPRRNSRYDVVGFDKKLPPPTWANAGLLCFDKRSFRLDLIEQWIARDRELMHKHATFEQRMYNLLLQFRGGAGSLPDSYSFNYTDGDSVATHFAIKDLFFENIPRVKDALVGW